MPPGGFGLGLGPVRAAAGEPSRGIRLPYTVGRWAWEVAVGDLAVGAAWAPPGLCFVDLLMDDEHSGQRLVLLP